MLLDDEERNPKGIRTREVSGLCWKWLWEYSSNPEKLVIERVVALLIRRREMF
jgi:hypothetical protein